MDIVATQKFVRTSPKKLRLVADAIRRVKPLVAIDLLPLMGLGAAEPMAKVIKTAVANAKQAGISDTDLIFKEIQISQGPSLKRGNPVSRGRWHAIKKRMSHIRVVLMTTEAKSIKAKAASEKAQEVKPVAKETKKGKDK